MLNFETAESEQSMSRPATAHEAAYRGSIRTSMSPSSTAPNGLARSAEHDVCTETITKRASLASIRSEERSISDIKKDHAPHTDSMVTIRLSASSAFETGSTLESREVEALPEILSSDVEFPGFSVPVVELPEADEEGTTEDRTCAYSERADLTTAFTTHDEDRAEMVDSVVGSSVSSSRHASLQSTTSSSTGGDPDVLDPKPARTAERSRSESMTSSGSEGSHRVDWNELDKNEEQEERVGGTDEVFELWTSATSHADHEKSTAFLLARLEQENNALATNPKANGAQVRDGRVSRPPSLRQLRKMVNGPANPALRYSLLPSPPPMTELEFWSALVRDYPRTAQRLPTLTSNKIRGGIPPPLRGVVWISIAGASDAKLEEEYERLCGESSPYEKLIDKDIGRSFPGVDMFRDPDGEGQRMLAKVLNAFSLWDTQIGYCQGLGFVVGPLLMHMGDKEAFCVLVRLMEHYDLRSCFLPDLSGLHLRIYQFQQLLSQHLPELTAHLDQLKLEPLYLSQWFLSFFGVTCPLPMLIRIYDVILTEGASETLMRVALSLMRRNEKKILATTEFEDIMQLLISRELWDTYKCNADDLVNDFCGLTGLVTRERLQALEMSFKESSAPTSTRDSSARSVDSAATRFLGRLWGGSSQSQSAKAASASPTLATPASSGGFLKRTPSKQSMASTLNSIESVESTQSTVTEATEMSQNISISMSRSPSDKDKDLQNLHCQIEDLLTALNDLQREHTTIASELQREREEREEDRVVVHRIIGQLRNLNSTEAATTPEHDSQEPANPLAELEKYFTTTSKRSSVTLQTKHQLREEASRWKNQYSDEAGKTVALSNQLTEREREAAQVKDQLRDARARVQDAHRDKQRLEKLNRELREVRKSSASERSASTEYALSIADGSVSAKGLRQFKLGRVNTSSTSSVPTVSALPTPPAFSKRMSSLSTHSILATEDHRPASEDALLLELVNAKTAEAVARQELDECQAKLDAMRKLLGGPPATAVHAAKVASLASPGGLVAPVGKAEKSSPPPKPAMPANPGGGFFSGWGKRATGGSMVSTRGEKS